jgi:hypothetical protein
LERLTRAVDAHFQSPDRGTQQVGHLLVGPPFHVLHDESLTKRRRKCTQSPVQIVAKLGSIQLFIRRRVRRGLIVLVVAEMSAPDVFQPILAPIRHNPENPCIEAPSHLCEMLVRLDEGRLENILRDVRASGHAQRMAVQRIAVPPDQSRERLAVPRKDPVDDLLIGFELIGLLRRHRSLHGASITRFASSG